MSEEKCTCPLSGFCQRRNIHVNSKHWERCQRGDIDHVDHVYAKMAARRAARSANPPVHDFADPAAMLNYTRALWAELHGFAFSDKWTCDVRCQWWTDWLSRVPRQGCGCKRKFKQILKELPPVWSSREEFFYRTVDWHNAVNQSLDPPKPVWEHDTALAHWRAIAES